jgi:hypothetical protein
MKKTVFVFFYFLFFFFFKTFNAQAAGILYQCKEDEVLIEQNGVWFGTDQKGFKNFQITELAENHKILISWLNYMINQKIILKHMKRN